MILENILGAIGKTPIVKFNSVGKELECDIFGKCEYFRRGSGRIYNSCQAFIT